MGCTVKGETSAQEQIYEDGQHFWCKISSISPADFKNCDIGPKNVSRLQNPGQKILHSNPRKTQEMTTTLQQDRESKQAVDWKKSTSRRTSAFKACTLGSNLFAFKPQFLCTHNRGVFQKWNLEGAIQKVCRSYACTMGFGL